MYIDLVVLILLIIGIVMYSRHFSSFVFIVAIIDVLLRILYFIRTHVGLPDFNKFVSRYFPESMFGLIDKYTRGDINIILKWIFVVLMIFFLYYIIRIWLKKKKF